MRPNPQLTTHTLKIKKTKTSITPMPLRMTFQNDKNKVHFAKTNYSITKSLSRSSTSTTKLKTSPNLNNTSQ